MKHLPASRPPRAPRFQAAEPVPLVAPVSLAALARFRRLMAFDGHRVDLPRMCLDWLYACELIALGHTSADRRLRDMALQLFGAYRRESDEPLQ